MSIKFVDSKDRSIDHDILRRPSSPPPPPKFQPQVSFDTFANKDASLFSYTLRTKHLDYRYTRQSRTFLCGLDDNDYSDFALEWLLDELVSDGDEVVCLRVVDPASKLTQTDDSEYRHVAEEKLHEVLDKNTENKKISIIFELVVGKVEKTIQRMIQVYEPAMLIVGTRGRSLNGFQGLMPGSVSKYCLQYSPVPVVVVRPSIKRQMKKAKRQADPGRRNYLDILDKGNDHQHERDPSASSDHQLKQSSTSISLNELHLPPATHITPDSPMFTTLSSRFADDNSHDSAFSPRRASRDCSANSAQTALPSPDVSPNHSPERS
ncbi:hypothetical protein CANCADRAFT_128770 [Tortispora caseinolytica NRRL Y-17796]|uniref:UspA domain-containing protein n=1 Tax=Tortispora caseinolytica NRRL Y-17796 TaxID=767744 RepID=A0A1E4TAN9_9ASCO|nr:hypothetical protein CANCADRAFT_128770 [Tortispora caseinolytica NRRL Y-17796]